MKFEMHTKITVNETEKRLHTEDNIFQIVLEGYHIFALDEIMPVYKTRQELVGSAVVKKLEWAEGRTTLFISTYFTSICELMKKKGRKR